MTVLQLNPENSEPRFIYNDVMEINNFEQKQISIESLMNRIELLTGKMNRLQDELNLIVKERAAMAVKITDAQSRIQKILNRLPQSSDNRQLNLLENTISETSHDE